MPDCAPFYPGHGAAEGDPAWAAAYPLLVGWTAELYEDDRIAARHFPGVAAFVEMMMSRVGGGGLYVPSTYGEWICAQEKQTE